MSARGSQRERLTIKRVTSMIITSNSAQSIVEEISSIIGRNINFMNEDGVIVASTDAKRIGTLHAGALKVLETRDTLIVNKDNQLEGAKEGINQPIMLGDKIVGVIGITGAEDEVVKYGHIIRKITEILVKEEFIEKRTELENRTRESFVKEWIEGRWSNDKLFVSRAWLLGINVHLPRIAVVLEYDQAAATEKIDFTREVQMEKERSKLIQFIQQEISADQQDMIIPDGNSKFIMLLTWQENTPDSRNEKTLTKIKYIINRLKEKMDVQFRVGAGTFVEHFSEMHESYKHAEKAISFQRKPHDEDAIVFFEDLRLELLVEELPEFMLSEFMIKVLGFDHTEEEHEFIETLTCFFACNQSINETASKLYIHKNTLQYRLKKIKEATGYDPRVLEDAVLLYLAIYIYHFKKTSEH